MSDVFSCTIIRFLLGWDELLFSVDYENGFDKYLWFQKYSSTCKISDVRMNFIHVFETTSMIKKRTEVVLNKQVSQRFMCLLLKF